MEDPLGLIETDLVELEDALEALVAIDPDKTFSAEQRMGFLLNEIDNNRKNSACASCPGKRKCKFIKWNKNHDFLRVVGCSAHPDQVKFKGHSTTVEFNLVATYSSALSREGVGSWSDAINNNDWNNLRGYFGSCKDYGGATYSNFRFRLIADTSALPDECVLASAFWHWYNTALLVNTDGLSLTLMKDTDNTHPASDNVTTSEYDRDNYDASQSTVKTFASISASAWNSIAIDNMSWISKTGTTRIITMTTIDRDAGSGLTNNNWCGVDTSTNLPHLNVTYNLPTAVRSSISAMMLLKR